MAAIDVNPAHVREFADADAFYDWLSHHHDRQDEVWIKIHKLASGLPSITPVQAIDVVLCWGWIDGVKKSFDAQSYLQRYTPRTRKSIWSQINVANVARLIEEGRMTPHGLKHVEAAKADGRWDAAYRIKGSTAPDDLMAAIDTEPQARATFDTLTAQNRFALTYRTEAPKTAAGRAKAVARLVEMLKRGETPHPQRGT